MICIDTLLIVKILYVDISRLIFSQYPANSHPDPSICVGCYLCKRRGGGGGR